MGTEFLSKLRAATKRALRLTTAGSQRRADHRNVGPDMGALFSRSASPKAELARADASWQPKPPLIRIEIMASGPFDGLRSIRATVNRLQHNLVTTIRKGTLELRLTEVRQTCRHSTAWSREPVDPGASTTAWQCFVDVFANESERSRTLFAQAFRESLRNRVNHVVVFGDDFNRRNLYHFLAVSTGGVFMHLSGQRSLDAVLPIVAAFACGDRARLAALSPAAPEAKALIAQLRRR